MGNSIGLSLENKQSKRKLLIHDKKKDVKRKNVPIGKEENVNVDINDSLDQSDLDIF